MLCLSPSYIIGQSRKTVNVRSAWVMMDQERKTGEEEKQQSSQGQRLVPTVLTSGQASWFPPTPGTPQARSHKASCPGRPRDQGLCRVTRSLHTLTSVSSEFIWDSFFWGSTSTTFSTLVVPTRMARRWATVLVSGNRIKL